MLDLLKKNCCLSLASVLLCLAFTVNAFSQNQYVQIKKGYEGDSRTLKEQLNSTNKNKKSSLGDNSATQNIEDANDPLFKKVLPTTAEVAKQIANSMKVVKPDTQKLKNIFGNSHKISRFNISATEVTQAQWESIMGYNPSQQVGPELPVENVTWAQCQEFIKKLNKLTGKKYRLPTVDEWMYAACGGQNSKGYKYSGSNRIAEVAWFDANSEYSTHRVGRLKKNEIALYDMSGNVAEWCSDAAGSSHAYVGGSCYDEAVKCAASVPESSRMYLDEASPRIGFRLAE